jgi:hypothetical protein
MDGILARAEERIPDMQKDDKLTCLSCEDFLTKISNRGLSYLKEQRLGVSISITCRILQFVTLRNLSCCSVQAIFKQIISWHATISSRSRAEDFESKCPNPSSVMCTIDRFKIFNLLKWPRVDVG